MSTRKVLLQDVSCGIGRPAALLDYTNLEELVSRGLQAQAFDPIQEQSPVSQDGVACDEMFYREAFDQCCRGRESIVGWLGKLQLELLQRELMIDNEQSHVVQLCPCILKER